ncbi:MAG: hypothetical protein PHI68_06380, partial [Candidatus Cloacimonetes bacterium]|nr:hypothetical protein [Candidatus Cloacimonadota bacterium]
DLAGLSLEDLANYQIVCGVTDGKGLSAYGLSKKLKINTTADLPTIPAFTVQDNANDKGDYNLVSISNPIAFVVLANYSDDSHKKIQLNYEVSENDLYKLDRLEIDISSPTNGKIASVTEYYIDKSIIFSLPEKHLKDNEFDLRITPIVLGKKGYTKYEPITQKIIYDAKNHRFDALDVYLKGQNLSTLYYDIATKTKLDDQHYPGNRINAINRAYDHLVSYETDMFMLVYGIDPKTKQLLLDPSIIVSVDSETGVPFQASLFRDEFEASIKEMHSKKASLEAQLKSSPASDSIAQELDMLSAQLASIEGNPAYKKAKTQKSDKKWLKTLMRAKDANSRSVSYQMIVTDGKGLHSFSEPFKGAKDQEYFYPVANWYNTKETSTLIGTLLFAVVIALTLFFVKRGKGMYIRPIAGLEELDNAVGRATEMGRPIMFVPGWGTLGDVCTISSMMILNQVAKKTAEYDTRLISPHADYFVVSLAQEMVRNAYSEVGRPDAFNQDDIFFVSDSQFAFSASVNGLTIRERVATIFYMGFFNAEVLIMTETGNQSGAIQIAGTDAITQVPFFITSCDYTLIGEEFYAASAYLSRDVELVSMLKASDYFKLMIIFFAVVGTILTTLRLNHILYLFPIE